MAEVNVEDLVAKYVKIRDKRKELEDDHKEKMAPYTDAMAEVENVLMAIMQANGLTNMKTAAGTASIKTKYNATLNDPGQFRNWVVEEHQLDLADIKANAPAVQAYVEEKGTLPPGVTLSAYISVGVRRASGT